MWQNIKNSLKSSGGKSNNLSKFIISITSIVGGGFTVANISATKKDGTQTQPQEYLVVRDTVDLGKTAEFGGVEHTFPVNENYFVTKLTEKR